MDSTLYIITGYTAVGKTRLSLDWAKENNAEIISCDSLLFYQHMNIGTAKPSAEELADVPHHLIDIVVPSQQYSIGEYLKSVKSVVEDIHSRGKCVLVVGGSGFYLNAFFASVVDGLALDPVEEARIKDVFENQALEVSVDELLRLNPDGLGDLDVNNPRRVFRAWLRCVSAGKTLREIKSEFQNRPGEFQAYEKQLLVLSRPRVELEYRVGLRVDQMLSDGLIEEVRQLLDLGIEKNASAAGSIGYRETIAFLKGEMSKSDLAETISRNTRKLLRKQRTWFKKYLPREAVIDVSALEALPDAWCHVPAK